MAAKKTPIQTRVDGIESLIKNMAKAVNDLLEKNIELTRKMAAQTRQINRLKNELAKQVGNAQAPEQYRALRVSNVGGLFPFLATPSNYDDDVHASEQEAIDFAKQQGSRFDGETFTVVPVYQYDEKKTA